MAVSSTPPSVPSPSVQPSPTVGSPQKSFTARYRRKETASINELEEYFKLPTEDFDACDPIRWWMGRRAQFPNLFRLARDVLCIPGAFFQDVFVNSNETRSCPGSAVAVERVFSGGRDAISLRRASLHADTIRILMLVKKRLHLAREKVNAALHH